MGQLRDGTKTVTTAGTAERLVAASTPAKWVVIYSNDGNTGLFIVVGSSTVVASEGTRRGGIAYPRITDDLAQNTPLRIPGPLDLTDLWVDVGTNGDKAHFIYDAL